MLGRVRKWSAMGRPLRQVSCGVCGRWPGEASDHGPGTYVLSFACLKLSKNFKPWVLVDSAVSVFAFVSACAQAVAG